MRYLSAHGHSFRRDTPTLCPTLFLYTTPYEVSIDSFVALATTRDHAGLSQLDTMVFFTV